MSSVIPIVHRYEATFLAFYVNAFLVETQSAVVAIDAALAIPDVDNLRAMLKDKIKKPLRAILLTHGHPDHYTGASHLMRGFPGDIPIVATKGTLVQCMARDEEESGYLASEQLFGAAYPRERQFPDQLVENGVIVEYDDVKFRLEDLGPAESDDDCTWTIDIAGVEHVFSGDIVYNKYHPFFHDGHTSNWLKVIDNCIARYDHRTVFHPGHGDDMGIEAFYWKRGYIQAFVRLLQELLDGRPTLSSEEQQQLMERMTRYLPSDRLAWLTLWQFDETVRRMREDGILK